MRRQLCLLLAELAGIIGASVGLAQTRIDLRSQGKSVNFSSADSTVPFKSGAVVPATCQAGEVFFQTGGTAGNNIHFCKTPNTWIELVTASSGTSVPPPTCATGSFYQRNDPVNGIYQLYVCPASGVWALSNFLTGTLADRPPACAAGQIYFSTDSGTAAWSYCQSPGSPGVWSSTVAGPQGPAGPAGAPGPAGPVCGSSGQLLMNESGGCTGVNQLPVASLPTPFDGWTPFALLAGAGSGVAPAVTSVTVDGFNNISIPGTITTGVGGDAAGSIVAMRGSGTAKLGVQGANGDEWDITAPDDFSAWTFTPPVAPCSAHEWWTTDSNGVGNCSRPAVADLSDSSNLSLVNAGESISGDKTYTGRFDASNASHSLPSRTGTVASAPSTCSIGEVYFATDAAPGRNYYFCTAANTWTQQTSSAAIAGTGITVAGSTVSFNPLDSSIAWWREEFMGGGLQGTGTVGAWGFTSSQFSGGSVVTQNVGSLSVTGHPGVYRLASAASPVAGSGAVMALGVAGAVNSDDLTSLNFDAKWVIRMNPTLTSQRVRVGFGNTFNSLTPGHGWFFRYDTDSAYDDDMKGSGDGRWVFQMCSGSSCTTDSGGSTLDMGVAPSSNWTTFRMRTQAGTLYLSINGGPELTACASGCNTTILPISNQGLYPLVAAGTADTSSVSTDVDLIAGMIYGLNR